MESFLSKRKREEEIALKKKMYETIAKVAIKYSAPGLYGYTDSQISEFWKYEEDAPSRDYFRGHIKVGDIRKVIKGAIKIDHEVWNSDFLHGLAKNCEVIDKREDLFPSLKWRNNEEIRKVVLASPFGGTLGKNFHKNDSTDWDRWSYVAALDMPYTEYSVSFVAGILASGKIVCEDGHYFSKYSGNIIDEIKKLHIPIEKEVKKSKFKGYHHYVLISPIWGALFSNKMPEQLRDKWFNLHNAYNAHTYAAILWRTYVDTKFKRKAIPYLKSRRMIFYEYKCEKGAMAKLENLRFKFKLEELDYSIRDIVKEWANNS